MSVPVAANGCKADMADKSPNDVILPFEFAVLHNGLLMC